MAMIEKVEVFGDATQRGIQLGVQIKSQLAQLVDSCRSFPPRGGTWADAVIRARPYRAATLQAFPYVIDEMDAMSEAAGLDPEDVFAANVEELYALQPPAVAKACSDIVACPPATKDDVVLVGHNNDLSPELSGTLALVERHFPSGLVALSYGLAGGTSAGINSLGLCLTGNEVTQTDVRSDGIPRAILASTIIYQESFNDAVSVALHPNRAASYNNIISTSDPSQVVSIEASATKFHILRPNEVGLLYHCNQYQSADMQVVEGKPNYPSSENRLSRLMALGPQSAPLTRKDIVAILRDHGPDNTPSNDTICRHGGETSESLFGFIAQLSDRSHRVDIAFGNPCKHPFETVWSR